MTKKNSIFEVSTDISLFKQVTNSQPRGNVSKGRHLDHVMEILSQQMNIGGYRNRTINDYNSYMVQFRKITGVNFLEEITQNTIYNWLNSMEVSNQTKLTRLKCLKAILGKCFNNGWIDAKFWQHINVKVDKKVKQGAKKDEVMILLSVLDLNTFIGLRDAVAILTMYRTGIRINTLGQLTEQHIDFENKLLAMDGSILKNHKVLKLPIDDELIQLHKVLIVQNHKIRNHYGEHNNNLFISYKGTSLNTKSTNNAISKQLHKYAKQYGLKNINPHALRRGFAKNLLDKGANLALISKALGHANLEVTTQYLDLDVDEVATNLRDFL